MGYGWKCPRDQLLALYCLLVLEGETRDGLWEMLDANDLAITSESKEKAVVPKYV